MRQDDEVLIELLCDADLRARSEHMREWASLYTVGEFKRAREAQNK